MSNYEDSENKFDSAFRTKALLVVLLGVGSVIGLIVGFHFLTGTIK